MKLAGVAPNNSPPISCLTGCRSMAWSGPARTLRWYFYADARQFSVAVLGKVASKAPAPNHSLPACLLPPPSASLNALHSALASLPRSLCFDVGIPLVFKVLQITTVNVHQAWKLISFHSSTQYHPIYLCTLLEATVCKPMTCFAPRLSPVMQPHTAEQPCKDEAERVAAGRLMAGRRCSWRLYSKGGGLMTRLPFLNSLFALIIFFPCQLLLPPRCDLHSLLTALCFRL